MHIIRVITYFVIFRDAFTTCVPALIRIATYWQKLRIRQNLNTQYRKVNVTLFLHGPALDKT